MRIKTIVASVLGFLALTSVAFAKTDKVNICHVTDSNTNPLVLISVSSSALPSFLSQGDFLYV